MFSTSGVILFVTCWLAILFFVILWRHQKDQPYRGAYIKGLRVRFVSGSAVGREGEVVEQEGGRLYVNWTNDKGCLIQTLCPIHQVVLIDWSQLTDERLNWYKNQNQ